jgi:hypothetical protein
MGKASAELGGEVGAGDAEDGVADDDETKASGKVGGLDEAEGLSGIGDTDDEGEFAFEDGLAQGCPQRVVVNEENCGHEHPSSRGSEQAAEAAERVGIPHSFYSDVELVRQVVRRVWEFHGEKR